MTPHHTSFTEASGFWSTLLCLISILEVNRWMEVLSFFLSFSFRVCVCVFKEYVFLRICRQIITTKPQRENERDIEWDVPFAGSFQDPCNRQHRARLEPGASSIVLGLLGLQYTHGRSRNSCLPAFTWPSWEWDNRWTVSLCLSFLFVNLSK